MSQTFPQSFSGFVQDGKIFVQSFGESPQQIGVNLKTHEELSALKDSYEARCREYYDKLVEIGVITPEPTPEQIMQRQSEQLQQNAAVMSELLAEIKALKGGNANGSISNPGVDTRPESAVDAGSKASVGAGPEVPRDKGRFAKSNV